jgi:ribonuclease Z
LTWLVQARLVNEPFGDPGLFIDFRFGRRALLFDLGDLGLLSPREILRVDHVFVSHMHMDHFAGFDRLLRLSLYRPVCLRLFGPPGFMNALEARLSSYTWNLLDESSTDFALLAFDIGPEGFLGGASFRAREAFRRRAADAPTLPPAVLLDEPEFRIETTMLDHGTPCLAFALQETLRVNVIRGALDELGLAPGPWLNEAKRAVRSGAADAAPVSVPDGRVFALGALKERLFRTAPGQRLAYVVDAAFTEPNRERVVALARGADHLFIESPFLQEDAALAARKRHLTTLQAGAMGREAGVVRLIPLHFSPRYLRREAQLRREVASAFLGEAPAPGPSP